MASLAPLPDRAAVYVEQEDAFSTFHGLPLPVTLRICPPLTDRALMRFSRKNRPYQIERNEKGDLEIMSPTGFEGSSRELYVGRMLGNWAEIHGGISVGATAGFKLGRGKAIRCPDAGWVSDTLASSLTKQQKEGYAPLCPEFLIEVRSKRDTRERLEAKMRLWIDAGAQLAWLIDPFSAEVLICQPGLEVEVLRRPDWVEALNVVPGFRLLMSPLWAKE